MMESRAIGVVRRYIPPVYLSTRDGGAELLILQYVTYIIMNE